MIWLRYVPLADVGRFLIEQAYAQPDLFVAPPSKTAQQLDLLSELAE